MQQIYNPKALDDICKNTLVEHLGIEFIEVSTGRVIARMPVDERTIQPMKRLHGGAVMALAETAGSAGSLMLVDSLLYMVLGVEISGSHVGTTLEPYVLAEATILHQGKTSHVWDVRVTDGKGVLISVCRLTNRIIPLKTEEK